MVESTSNLEVLVGLKFSGKHFLISCADVPKKKKTDNKSKNVFFIEFVLNLFQQN